MTIETLTTTPKGFEAFGALQSTDFEFNTLGKVSISDAALTAAIDRNCPRSYQASSKDIFDNPPWPWP